MKLQEEANVEINDYGNDLSDVEKFAKHLGIEINIIDAEQFNSIVYTANQGSEDKIYLLKTRNHFDVIKSLTAFYDTPYYCHECKKAHTKRDKHKCPSKCLSCFTYAKDKKCEGKEIVCDKCNRKFFGKRCFKNHLKNRSKASTKGEGKQDIVCDTVKKFLDCSRIITGKYVNSHKCSYSECANCGKYVGKDHKCYLKKVKAKGGYCMTGNKEPCKNNDSIKKKDWCYPCRTYTEKYVFYDFEATYGVNVKHALNGVEKELTIGDKTYKVDGFCKETNTVYEFYGCFWHGCPNCYKPNIINSKNPKDMGTLNDVTVENRDTIKNAGYNHVSTYECQLAKNKDFQKFSKNFTQEIVEPLNPRDAFYGGRTNATKLQYNFKDNECMQWTLRRFLFSVSNSPVLPKISNWSPYQNIQPRKV